jgi:hypothetical protein
VPAMPPIIARVVLSLLSSPKPGRHASSAPTCEDGLDLRLRGAVRQAHLREDAFPGRPRWQGPPIIGPFIYHFDVQTIMPLGE